MKYSGQKVMSKQLKTRICGKNNYDDMLHKTTTAGGLRNRGKDWMCTEKVYCLLTILTRKYTVTKLSSLNKQEITVQKSYASLLYSVLQN